MANKPTYEELEQRVKELENESFERKKAEAVLKEKELKLRMSEQALNSILRNSPDIIYRLDPKGTITYVNDTVRKYGYSREDLIGKNLLEFIHPDDREKAAHRINERRTGDRSTKSLEIRLVKRDFTYAHFEDKSRGFEAFLIDAEGIYNSEKAEKKSFAGTQGIARDIFERKQAEDGLRKSEEKYRSLITNIPDVTWTTDYEGKTSFISPNIEKEYGYTPEEITKGGDSIWLGRIHPEDAGKVKNAFRKLFEEGTMLDVEYRIKRKDGEWIWLHDRSIAIYERDGVMYADGIFTNITERKRMAEVLQRSEEHHHSFMESAKGFIVYRLEVDPENYFSGRLIFVSPGIEDEIGVSPEAEFSEWFKSVHPDDLPALIEAQSKSVQNGDTFDQEFRWKNLMGGWRWCHAISNPVFDSEGKPKYYNGMIIDVTPQKQAEKSLQESERHLRSLMENATNFAVYRLISDDDNPSLLSVIFVSPSITDIMGVSEPMSFETWFEHVHPDDVERIVKANIEAFKTLRFDETMRIYHPQEQKWVWIHAISTGFEDHERQCKYVNGILFDITRQEKSNEALRENEGALKESENFLNTLINAIPAPVFYKDMDGKYLGFNSAFETFFGAPREQLIGKSVFDTNPPELAEIYHSQDNELLNSGGSQLYESQWKNAHGKLRDFIFNKAVFTDSKGTITGLIGVLTDITERKRAEQALKNNQIFLKRIINQSPFATWISDEKGTMIKCNAALKKILNVTDEQLIGKYNVFEDEVAIEQGLIPKIRTVFEDGKTANFSVEWDADELGYKDAKKVHIEGTMFPIHDDKGDLTNVVDHWIDVTDRKQQRRRCGRVKRSTELFSSRLGITSLCWKLKRM